MYFQYDTNGIPLGFTYNGEQYFYLTNQMGDVIAIVDAIGNPFCEYDYNEWGEVVYIYFVDLATEHQIAVGNANPLCYRGYYYDAETGYYYLQSRYYDPSICRFINADIAEIAQMSKDVPVGINIFVYCGSNPINNADYNGKAYSPSKAKKYADKWWRGRNTKQYKTNKEDCANFVSQCLYAGKLSFMTKDWYHKVKYGRRQISNAWGRAHDLYKWLIANHYVRKTFSSTSKSIVDKVGKFIYNYRSNTHCVAVIFFDYTNDGIIDYAMLSGEVTRCSYNKNLYNIYYYAHSSNRKGVCMQYLDKYNHKYYASIKNAFCIHEKLKAYFLFLV